ncbi:peptidase M23-like protein [Murinocardiopsis flavida]|uniref:Peptidase M23-like protein n=1 Tax=Murinocardiopsis flavida TaxID=645275 RepID=A0A2P8CW16_9ACTN|nr:M23 family metallopeptidase [Murinocardiopsis flavida]PSK89164.1 peptidase M23-like protein [Murinocardiopsis flavida]
MRQHPGATRRLARGGAVAAASAALLATALQAPAAAEERAAAALNLRTPFDCGQVWNANTRSNHNPQNSVDFQRSGANGKNVLSSGAGTVTVKRDLGGDSYGKYLVVDHGGGWQTLYAHLSSFNVNKGAKVNTGTRIGKVGSTGGSTGPHLHYEQKKNGTPVKVVINNVAVKYYGNTSITSSTNC